MYTVTKLNEKRYLSYIADSEEQPEVLSILKGYFGMSSRKIKSVKFSEDGLFVNGIRENVRKRLKYGDRLLVMLDDVTAACDCLISFPFDLNIIYEDEDLLFIEKPTGLVCHPSQGHYADSIINAACAVLRDRGEKASLHLLGRLDKDTSGIVGFAKNSYIQEKMDEQRMKGLFYKEYYAIVHGCPREKNGRLTTALTEELTADGRHTYMVEAAEDEGKSADTSYEVVRTNGELSLCRVHIRTGRTHQIRFHMSHMGHPLIGDERYGGSTDAINRAALHAGKVSFVHPITGEKISFSVEMPQDMKKIASLIEK